MSYKKITTTYTNLIFQGKKLKTYAQSVKEFEVEVYLSDASHETLSATPIKNFFIPAEKKELITVGSENYTITDLIKGNTYAFRIRYRLLDGSASQWSLYSYETAGDISIDVGFTNPSKDCGISSIHFSVELSTTLPEDFDRFEWFIEKESYDNPQEQCLSDTSYDEPAMIDNEEIATYITYNPNDISIDVNGKSKDELYHCWIRAVDQSGNFTDWFYVATGKINFVDLQSDVDNIPPDGTTLNNDSTFWDNNLPTS